MSTRSVRLRNLLVLVAIFTSIVVLGCWDNRREMVRVLDQGYAVDAQITGAQSQRLAPFAVDGWRPRFVEQALSVDLQWIGKDGKTRVHRKVPVSDRFARSIVTGEQVRLIAVPVKALDDGVSVPVLTFDAAARLESLRQWLAVSGYMALAAWAVVGAIGFAQWRRKRRPAITVRTPSKPLNIPPQRTMVGIVALCVGAFMTFSALSASESANDGGTASIDVSAEIVAAAGPPYTVQLGWRDEQGGVHHFGPLPISAEFWKKITRDGKLVVHETKARLRADDTMARPVILDDPPEMSWRTKAVLAAGLALLALGAGCLLSTARAMRRF